MERNDIYMIQGEDYKQMAIKIFIEKASVCIGQGYNGKTGRLGIGKCTRCFDKSLGGCPPKAVDIAGFLEKEWFN